MDDQVLLLVEPYLLALSSTENSSFFQSTQSLFNRFPSHTDDILDSLMSNSTDIQFKLNVLESSIHNPSPIYTDNIITYALLDVLSTSLFSQDNSLLLKATSFLTVCPFEDIIYSITIASTFLSSKLKNIEEPWVYDELTDGQQSFLKCLIVLIRGFVHLFSLNLSIAKADVVLTEIVDLFSACVLKFDEKLISLILPNLFVISVVQEFFNFSTASNFFDLCQSLELFPKSYFKLFPEVLSTFLYHFQVLSRKFQIEISNVFLINVFFENFHLKLTESLDMTFVEKFSPFINSIQFNSSQIFEMVLCFQDFIFKFSSRALEELISEEHSKFNICLELGYQLCLKLIEIDSAGSDPKSLQIFLNFLLISDNFNLDFSLIFDTLLSESNFSLQFFPFFCQNFLQVVKISSNHGLVPTSLVNFFKEQELTLNGQPLQEYLKLEIFQNISNFVSTTIVPKSKKKQSDLYSTDFSTANISNILCCLSHFSSFITLTSDDVNQIIQVFARIAFTNCPFALYSSLQVISYIFDSGIAISSYKSLRRIVKTSIRFGLVPADVINRVLSSINNRVGQFPGQKSKLVEEIVDPLFEAVSCLIIKNSTTRNFQIVCSYLSMIETPEFIKNISLIANGKEMLISTFFSLFNQNSIDFELASIAAQSFARFLASIPDFYESFNIATYLKRHFKEEQVFVLLSWYLYGAHLAEIQSNGIDFSSFVALSLSNFLSSNHENPSLKVIKTCKIYLIFLGLVLLVNPNNSPDHQVSSLYADLCCYFEMMMNSKDLADSFGGKYYNFHYVLKHSSSF
ncbi:hypothetical protein GEMRC1_004617 [Eukaryota sp. GEM-RC1]